MTEPDLVPLTGQYGGRLLLVTATDTAAHFEFACWDARTGPLRLDHSGIADGRGTAFYRGKSWSASFRVAVRQRGDSLLVVASFFANQSDWTATHTVRRNAPADFSGTGCLAVANGSLPLPGAWAAGGAIAESAFNKPPRRRGGGL